MKKDESEFMSHELRLPELTVRGMMLGAVLTVIFTASNVYLGLKVGLTFSSAIPAAVISLAVIRVIMKKTQTFWKTIWYRRRLRQPARCPQLYLSFRDFL